MTSAGRFFFCAPFHSFRFNFYSMSKLLLARPIAFHPVFVDLTGSGDAAIMLSQALYWSRIQEQHTGGWFWKTQEQWTGEVRLSRRNQETARKHLREASDRFKAITGAPFWEEVRQGNPAKLWFRVDEAALLAALDCLESSSENGGNVHSSMAEPANQECTNRTNSNGGTAHSKMAEPAKHSIQRLQQRVPESTEENTDALRASTPSLPPAGMVAQTAKAATGAAEERTREKEAAKEAGKAVRIPEGFAMTPDMRQWASEHAPDVAEVTLERLTLKFKNHYRGLGAKDKHGLSADWVGKWQGWVIGKQEEIEKAGAGARQGNGPVPRRGGRPTLEESTERVEKLFDTLAAEGDGFD